MKHAFLSNNDSKLGAKVKQTRWLILTHALPVRSRLHKFNNKIENNRCPFCPLKETIRHCIFRCNNIKHIWEWFNKLWQALTTDTLPNTNNYDWIYNNIKTNYEVELKQCCDIIIHRIWINKNKKKFNPKATIK